MPLEGDIAMKGISILGSTGSIGTQTLDVIDKIGGINVVALTAGSNIKLLEEQARKYQPRLVAVWDEERAHELKTKLADTDIAVYSGMDGLIEAATCESSDMILTAVVGMIGIQPTIAAIIAGKDIALANKETLVCAGHIIMPLAKHKQINILPVDSEHSAIFQCLQGNESNKIEKILLTASGGPFRTYTRDMLEAVTVEDALKHPNWSMGRKITIDSSTMVNKGLEVIEARWLFDVNIDDIEVVIQPGSIIHSMVQYEDGAIMAQLGLPDMRTPIAYALYYPKRYKLDDKRMSLASLRDIPMESPNTDVFPALALAYDVGRKAGSMPTVFNAANEYAVAAFLEKKIRYVDIYRLISKACEHIAFVDEPTVEDILNIQKEAERYLESII